MQSSTFRVIGIDQQIIQQVLAELTHDLFLPIEPPSWDLQSQRLSCHRLSISSWLQSHSPRLIISSRGLVNGSDRSILTPQNQLRYLHNFQASLFILYLKRFSHIPLFFFIMVIAFQQSQLINIKCWLITNLFAILKRQFIIYAPQFQILHIFKNLAYNM